MAIEFTQNADFFTERENNGRKFAEKNNPIKWGYQSR